MSVNILQDYGWCQVIERDGKYFVVHDVGGVVVQMREDKVTREQAELAAKDEKFAQRITMEIIKSRIKK